MNNPNEIEIGDTVRVFMVYHRNDNPENWFGKVLYMPQATGDCWHIRDQAGVLRYVQSFAEMTLERKAASFPESVADSVQTRHDNV